MADNKTMRDDATASQRKDNDNISPSKKKTETEKADKEGSDYSNLTGFNRAVPIIMIALAVFLVICFITSETGIFGNFISEFLLGCFSFAGYLIPLFLFLNALFYASDVAKRRVLSRVIFTLVALVTLSATIFTIYNFGAELTYAPTEFYEAGKALSGGGAIGGIVAYGIIKVFGYPGFIIIAILAIALYITYFFANGKSTLAKILLAILNKISSIVEDNKAKAKEKKEAKERAREDAAAPRISEKHEELYDDDFFTVNTGMRELSIPELGIKETASDDSMEKLPHLHDKVIHTEGSQRASSDGRIAAFVNGDGDEVAEVKKADTLDVDFGEDRSAVTESFEEPTRTESTERKERSAGESADEVFTKDFDPFDLAMNSTVAERNAERTKLGIGEYSPSLAKSAEDEERARERAEYEAMRTAMLEAEARRAEIERQMTEREKLATLLDDEEAERPRAVYSEGRAGTPINDAYSRSSEKQTSETVIFGEDTPRKADEAARDEDKYQRAASFISGEDAPRAEKRAAERSDESIKLIRDMLDPSPSTAKDKTISLIPENDEDFDDDFEDEETNIIHGTAPDEDDVEFETEEIPPERQNPDVIGYREMFSALRNDTGAEKATAYDVTEKVSLGDEDDEDEPPFEVVKPKVVAKPSEAKSTAAAPDYSGYKMPPMDLLKKGEVTVDDTNDEINANSEKLVDTLAQFNVKVSISGIDVGPRITRYEVVPAKGVRVNAVINLFDDISLSLAAEGIRMEAPIPGKSAIGVEIPNKHPQMVYLRDLLETEEFRSASSPTMACFGKDVTGTPVLGDIAKMPHMLIAGATGMGKSVCINALMISMLYRAKPDELKFIMIDPKMVEFNGYNGIPHLLIPVVTDVKQAAGALMWAVEQMEKRYEMFLQYSVRNLDGYNQKMREDPSLGSPLSKIVIVIDELNDLMLQARKPVEDLIMRIAQKARAAGIHLIIGTQRPSVDVITGVIKANIPSRIACKVASFNDSKTILEQAGAEKLLNNGDMLFWPVGKPKPTRVQGAFVSDKEVENIMNFLKKQNPGTGYDEQALEEINRAAQKCAKGGKGGDDYDDDDDDGSDGVGIFNDPQFLDAVELAVKQGKISTSLLQRKIGIGYGKAAKYIDMMEEQNFVSEPNGQKPRDVLITRDEWHEILSRRSIDD